MKKRCMDLGALNVESFQTGAVPNGMAREQEEVVGAGFDTFRNCPTAYACPPTPLH